MKHKTIGVLLAVAAANSLHMRQLDVKGAYLNVKIDEALNMEQLPHFEIPGQEDKVCQLQRIIYGLKQSV